MLGSVYAPSVKPGSAFSRLGKFPSNKPNFFNFYLAWQKNIFGLVQIAPGFGSLLIAGQKYARVGLPPICKTSTDH